MIRYFRYTFLLVVIPVSLAFALIKTLGTQPLSPTVASPILLIDGSSQRWILPVNQSLTQALHSANLTLSPTDRIFADGSEITADQFPVNVRVIRIQRAVLVRLTDGKVQRSARTAGDTVAEALSALQISLYNGDQVQPPLDTALTEGLLIVIQRSVPITIEFDGRQFSTRTRGRTVAEALVEAGIAVLGADVVTPPEQSPISPSMVIRIRRDQIDP